MGGIVLDGMGAMVPKPVEGGGTSMDDDDDGSNRFDGAAGSGLDGRQSLALTIGTAAASAVLVVAVVAGMIAYMRHVAAGLDQEEEKEELADDGGENADEEEADAGNGGTTAGASCDTDETPVGRKPGNGDSDVFPNSSKVVPLDISIETQHRDVINADWTGGRVRGSEASRRSS